MYPFKKYKLSSLHGKANREANILDGGKLSRRLLNVSIKKISILSSLHGMANRVANIRNGGKLSRHLLNVSI
jgi:hypothetical protein